MANRFTDSQKWDDPWFRKLPCKYKAFWLFLLDKCNHAGVWKIDFESATFHIGEVIIKSEALSFLNGKIHEYNDKWFIKKFIFFQYGILSEANRVHNSVIQLLKKEGLWKVYTKTLEGLKDQDQDQDQDQDLVKEEDLKGKQNFLEKYNSLCPNLPKALSLTNTRKNKITIRLKEHPLDWWIETFKKADTVCIPGKDDRGDWQPNIDWLIMNDTNAVKVAEGKYNYKERRFSIKKGGYNGGGKSNKITPDEGKYAGIKSTVIGE